MSGVLLDSDLAELADVVGQELRVRKFPQRVTYAPERAQRLGPGVPIGVLFERDRASGDTIAGPVATRQGAATPEAFFVRQLAGAFTVYATSPQPGASARHHEAEVDHVCDAVISAMYRACKLAGKPLAFTGSRLLDVEDLPGSDDPRLRPGAVARVTFTIAIPIQDYARYRGGGPGVGVVDDVANAVEAKQVAAPDE